MWRAFMGATPGGRNDRAGEGWYVAWEDDDGFHRADVPATLPKQKAKRHAFILNQCPDCRHLRQCDVHQFDEFSVEV